MPLLYKERPNGEFISTALHFIYTHLRPWLLRVWLPSMVAVGVTQCFVDEERGTLFAAWTGMLWMWWWLAESVLRDDAQTAHRLSVLLREQQEDYAPATKRADFPAEKSDLSDEKSDFFDSKSDIDVAEADRPRRKPFRLPGFRRLSPLRMLLSAAITALAAITAAETWWLSLILLFVLYFVIPVFLIYTPRPGKSFLGTLPALTARAIPSLALFGLFMLFWAFVIAVSGGLAALLFSEVEWFKQFVTVAQMEAMWKAVPLEIRRLLAAMLGYSGILLQGTASATIVF